MADLERTRLLHGVNVKDARAVALWAPAGYGKSTLARQFARRYFQSRVIDAAGVGSDGEFAWRVACALDPQSEAQAPEYDACDDAWIERARRTWRAPFPGVVIFENCERLALIHGGEQLLRELLAATPHPRTIVCCARMPIELGFTRFALPHETYVLAESELAFDSAEVQRVLECSGDQAALVWDVTRGWPLCVRMIARVARERPLDEVCSRLETASFDSLYDYLLEHIFEVIPEDSRSCSVAFAAIPRCTHQDIVKLYGVAADPLRQRALSSGLVAVRDGAYELHPLVRASILRRNAAVAVERLCSAAEAWRTEHPERAALLYLEAGEADRAAGVLQSTIPDSVGVVISAAVHALCRRIPRTVLVNYPRLWSSATTDGYADLTEPPRYRLIVGSQALYCGQERVALTNRETELLCYLGMRGAATSVHELAEAMVPQKDSASAGRMLRVLIARVRKRCGREIVMHEDDGYRLGAHVNVACREILRRFALLRNDRLTEYEIATLRRDIAEVRLWTQGTAPAWEWARELEDYVAGLEVKLATRLERARAS